MKAAESKRLTVVGIFIFVALIIFIAGILTLGGQQKRFVDTIKVYAIFDDVAGLKTGNNVWFSGVKIGTVKDIKFYGDAQVRITMNIEEASIPYIRKDAKARLGSESLIGNKIIEIYGGTRRSSTVEDEDVLASEEALDTDVMMETLQKNNENLVSITSDFKTLSNRLVAGQGTMGAVLNDSLMADNFRAIVNNLKQTSSTTLRASAALSRFTAKLNTPEGLANQLLTDTAVFNQIRSSATQLEKTAAAAAEMTQNLNETSRKLDDNNNAVGVLLNDPQFAGSLKNTMVHLEKSSINLNEDLEALKTNFLLRGYFKRKATREAKQQERQQTREEKHQEKVNN
ncbi:mammalian cell entry protein [Adhaeribacter aerolatus]|uniref:Mammalian cell entry protein n=1 Tax=Adhaeribacter aerolatus TaxID=670289 RepID=A0A512B229_9BACT|nr:MlaD family protein [Adhaeribacter aerolatus]GEO05857.1 mammalian cell entry protein [Adhaeribacter aerolatus]